MSTKLYGRKLMQKVLRNERISHGAKFWDFFKFVFFCFFKQMENAKRDHFQRYLNCTEYIPRIFVEALLVFAEHSNQ